MTRDYFQKFEDDSAEKNKMDSKEKWTLGILSVLAVGILVFGFLSISSKVKVPFAHIGNDGENVAQAKLESLNNVTDDSDLRFSDSDEDGLSDYDEMYFYGTSPYLDDTDSDGYTDKLEIERGDDPTCPKGSNCYGSVSGSTSLNKTPEYNVDLVDLVETQDYGSLVGSNDAGDLLNDPELMRLMSGDASADDLRKILKEAGVSEEELGKIDDELLLQTYRDSLGDTIKEQGFEDGLNLENLGL